MILFSPPGKVWCHVVTLQNMSSASFNGHNWPDYDAAMYHAGAYDAPKIGDDGRPTYGFVIARSADQWDALWAYIIESYDYPECSEDFRGTLSFHPSDYQVKDDYVLFWSPDQQVISLYHTVSV